jgi:hypothetical protein
MPSRSLGRSRLDTPKGARIEIKFRRGCTMCGRVHLSARCKANFRQRTRPAGAVDFFYQPAFSKAAALRNRELIHENSAL